MMRLLEGSSINKKKSFAKVSIKPMVVQNKFDIYHVGKQIDPQGDHIISLVKEHDMRMVAYSSFSSFPFSLQPTEDPILRHLASSKSLSGGGEGPDASQIALRWMLQQGVAIIPRSSNLERLRSNLEAALHQGHKQEYALTDEEMMLVSSISHLTASPISKAVVY